MPTQDEARERCLDALEAAQLAVALYDVDVSLLLNLARQCEAVTETAPRSCLNTGAECTIQGETC